MAEPLIFSKKTAPYLPMKMSPRSQRLAGIIEEKISLILQHYVTPDEVGFLTVRSVEVSGDLGIVDIFMSSIGGPRDFVSPLQKNAGKIARELSQFIETRRVPKLRFKIDKSVENMEKLNKIQS